MSPTRRAGLALLVFALVVASGYAVEAARFQEHEVRWRATESAAWEDAGEVATGEAWARDLEVAAGPVASVEASLSWTDAAGEPDVLRLVLVAPDGTRHESEPSDSGAVALSVVVNADPGVVLVGAPSAYSARALAPSPFDASAGVGAWRVEVELVEAPGQRVASQDVPGAEDGRNAIEVAARATVWTVA